MGPVPRKMYVFRKCHRHEAVDTYVGHNNDEVYLVGNGVTYLIPLEGTIYTAVWFGEWTVTGGTGLFANAGPDKRPIQMVVVNEPFDIVNDPVWNYSFIKKGRFDLGIFP